MAAEDEDGLFSTTNRKALTDPFLEKNPITILVLGVCSALAVTAKLQPSLVMGLSVIAVVAGSNVLISMIRGIIPNSIRIIVYMVVIASLVILVEQILKAYSFDMYRQLSVFVGLIITNCIVMGRLEGFAMNNKAWPSLLDGIGNGTGYALILVVVGFCRELLGFGTVWGYTIIPKALYATATNTNPQLQYVDNGLMVLAPGAFILLGLIIWVQRTISKYVEE
jgi:Na+-transporting NADH:ubiquinone oxidoreductase subunit D